MREHQFLDRNLRSVLSREIPGAVLAVAQRDKFYLGSSGNLGADSQFFIASATKLYTTALILYLVDSKKLKLRDSIEGFLSPSQIEGLHVHKGVDYSRRITVEHLLSHTSGLPDYFQAVRKSESSLMKQVLSGFDQSWDLNRVLADAKALGSVFPPSNDGKALYSDTNFQILGHIVEQLSGDSLAEVIQKRICQSIGLKNTYLYQDETDRRPEPLNFGKSVLNIPLAMTSFGADGGIVSTAKDGITFLRGFFEGRLFDQQHIPYLTSTWRKIFFPLKYGVGVSLFRLPWYFSPFKKFPDLVGHSGLSGAFLFFCPERKLYFSGTVNQVSRPQTSFRLLIGILQSNEISES